MGRIRTEHLNHELQDHLEGLVEDGREPTAVDVEKLESMVLARALVASLSQPRVQLQGRRLPQDGVVFCAGRPATNLPDDTYPGVVEALLDKYTQPGDEGVCLFGRSATPLAVAHQMDREMHLVDVYGDRIMGACYAIQRPGAFLTPESIALLIVHLPCPGIIDRERLLYFGGDEPPQNVITFEHLSQPAFFDVFAQLVSRWRPYLAEDAHLVVQSGYADFGQGSRRRPQRVRLAPLVWEQMTKLGFHIERQHPVAFELGNLPITHPALKHADLQVFTQVSP